MNEITCKLIRRCGSPAAALLLTITVNSPGISNAAPGWTKELTSPIPGNFKLPVPMSVELQISWQGLVRAGVVKIDFAPPEEKKSGAYIVRAHSKSEGPAAVFFPYESSFWAEISPQTLRPIHFRSVETDDVEAITTTVRHDSTRAASTEISKRIKSGEIRTKRQNFKFSPIYDIFSAMLHVRSQRLKDGDQIALVIVPFDTPYLLRVRVQGREIHAERQAIRLIVGMRKIDRKTMELLPYKKLKRDATLWLTDDEDRIPLELQAAAFIGSIRATLVKAESR